MRRFSFLSVVVFVVLALSMVAVLIALATQRPATVDVNADDLAVLHAVLEGFLLPDVDREDRRRMPAPGRLLLVEQTIRFCAEGNTIDCASPARLPSDERAALVQRNRAVAKVPPISQARVTFISEGESRELTRSGNLDAARLAYSDTVGIIQVTLPAYPRAGRAIVYATRYCGNLCGSGWLVRVVRRAAEWKVERAVLLWMS